MPIFVIILAVGIAACSQADEPEENEPETEVIFEGLEGAIADARCDAILRCCDSDALEAIFAGFDVSSKQDCERTVSEFVRVAVLGGLSVAYEDGAVEVDPDERDACLGAMRQQSCSEITAGLDFFEHPECQEFIAPALETSQFCTEDYACRSGFCAQSDTADEGSCAEPPEIGDACRAGRCAPGAFCDRQVETCTALRSPGQACTRNEECASNACMPDSDSGRVCAVDEALCQE